MVRLNSRQTVMKAIEGHPIEVHSTQDYMNLYHVFERIVQSDRESYGNLKIVRRSFGFYRWRVFVAKDEANVAGELEPIVR